MGTTGRSEVADGLRERVIGALRAGRDLGGLLTELGALPPGRPERGAIAAEALEIIVTDGLMADPRRGPETEALLALADGAVPSTERWDRIRTIAATTSQLGRLVDGRSMDIEDVSARLSALAVDRPDDEFLAAARSMLEMVGTIEGDDLSSVRAALDEISRRTTAAGGVTSGPLAAASSEAISFLEMMSSGSRVSDDELDRRAAEADASDAGGLDAAMRHTGVATAALRGGQETDLRRVDLGVEHARKAVDRADPGDARRVVHLTGLALALMRRFELAPSTTDDLRSARDPLEEARTLAGGPGHPQWQMIGEMLSEVRRHLGDDGADVSGPAVEGLREHVWRVLAQGDPDGVRSAARAAAVDAVDVARRCLAVADPARAVAALDSGRGLALFAATATRTIGDLLDDAGHPELSGRWRAAAASGTANLPGALRREVLAALAGTDGDAWLDPPTPARIGRALQAVDADALAYLVPGDNGLTGYAVVVSAAGRPGFMALPNLAVEHYREIEDYLAAAARRDASGMTAEALDDEFGDVLDRLCTWAWGAAMGPLVESYLPGLPEPADGRCRRIVLVPMGDLARVPWHAARDERRGRYVVESVAVSQAASARMLCRSGELSTVTPTAGGLVVGDPDAAGAAPDLAHARVEAFAIRESFYRGARYLGRRPNGTTSRSGSGTVEQVRRWITSEDPADGAAAHLACHGVVRATGDEPSAHLVLAGREELDAVELAGLLAGRPDRGIGLVVLSGCRTGGSPYGHDEAYSLGTALLAGGVRSVLCTQWNSADLLHPALMYMVHHHLRAEGLPVWAALHRAQLWALDRKRPIPPGMPTQLHRAARSAALGRVLVWASVGHWGQ